MHDLVETWCTYVLCEKFSVYSWEGSRTGGLLHDFIKLITRFVLAPVKNNLRLIAEVTNV